jgi:formylglycine-generating enzyme required for sulfatase activity
MLRGTAVILICAVLVSWAGSTHKVNFRKQMVPVRMAGNIGKTLLVSPFEVSVAEWSRCSRAKVCKHQPVSSRDENVPVTGVNWFDVNQYITWANSQSGGRLRLPTHEEWRWLNRDLQKPEAPPAFTDPRLAWAANYGGDPGAEGPVKPRGSFSRTSDGISDLDGNVWEWTSTCAKPTLNGSDPSFCAAYVAEGEHEAAISIFVRDPRSGGCTTGTPPAHIGFRLVANVE